MGEGGLGRLEGNKIEHNTMNGVTITTGSNPVLLENTIQACGSEGVVIMEHSRGALEENEIYGNAFGGVTISDTSDPTLLNNQRVHDLFGQESIRAAAEHTVPQVS